MRRSAALVVPSLALALLAGCGTATVGPAREGPAATTDVPGPATGDEVVTQGIVMQSAPGARVEICIGPVLTSYPPQCGGPALLGAFSWDDVVAEEQAGVRWTDAGYVAVGTYDRDADTFTLTRPLTSDPPPDVQLPTPPPVEFPQLCEDPFRGGDPGFTEDIAAQERLHRRLETLDGYVTSWVSDGVDLFNVVVTGDPEEAFVTVREVWQGGLCVAQRDGPTAADVEAAQAALQEKSDELGMMGSGSGGVSGLLEIDVFIADSETTAQVHDLVSPWLAADEVRITGAIVPLAPLSQG